VDGIEIERVDGATLVIVRTVSETFCAHVRAQLAEYCYGAALVSENSSFYSFERTVAEFLARFDPKPVLTKIGMAGELIVHVLMPLLHEDLAAAAVYFNKEERSIKKGFDLTFLGTAESAIWYGEVKSGEVAEGASADEKAADLVILAASSLASMLDDTSHLSRWDAALIDTQLTLEAGFAKTARELLRSDSDAIRAGGRISKRAVLAGAVLHDLGHCVVTPVGVAEIARSVAETGHFADAKILVIQQHALESVIEHLREVAHA